MRPIEHDNRLPIKIYNSMLTYQVHPAKNNYNNFKTITPI